MKAILIALIMLTAAQAVETTCYRDGNYLYCETEEDPFKAAAREEMAERQAEHYQRMEELAERAAYAAEIRALEEEARSYE